MKWTGRIKRKLHITLSCNALSISLIRGYIIGSPTSDKAQCRTVNASFNRSGCTPGTPISNPPINGMNDNVLKYSHSIQYKLLLPLIWLIMFWCKLIAVSTIISGSSVFQRHSVPTMYRVCDLRRLPYILSYI
jgi:hypothetical protein